MKTEIIIVGALGRMGVEIAKVALADEDVSIAACVEYPSHPSVGKDYGECIGVGHLGIAVAPSLDEINLEKKVVIDFSSIESTRANLKNLPEKGNFSMVIGTTGLQEDDYQLAQNASKHIAVLVSPNTSLGVNLLFSLTELVASSLKDRFDMEIIEAHHRFKKDSPSGTAKRLGEIISSVLEKSYDEAVVDGRSGMASQTRPATEVGMHAVRGGDIVGDHTVLFAGIGERIELRHMAHSRSTFARGAVETAKWISSKDVGFYSMKDVLGI
ncbi:4-hydroxy-tetrahydrodipicolinate reductase [Chitinispirillales bacterium ANBcel5]|uniref:4-hydroxy-tetrahydrodipicolinate reductase n=1 Tax=Cellulosispirillum alkaliphilum TaxID=3039283 RepID=UPI002A55FFAE|nr:4-hydroxy-tetrahydrodipicolinate reductase [Chitinispirillales bacterium ANBcel5]